MHTFQSPPLSNHSFHGCTSFSSVPNSYPPNLSFRLIPPTLPHRKYTFLLRSKTEDNIEAQEGDTKGKQSLFSAITDALDFSQVRSSKDAELIEDARAATRSGGQMSPEQYGALRRKIGGTYRDFFKDSIEGLEHLLTPILHRFSSEVDGEYVDDGWVDKTCRFCKKDTSNDERTVDKLGRYAHVACLEKANSGNFFTRLFGR